MSLEDDKAPLSVFLSYCFKDEAFAAKVSHLLKRQPGLKPFLYADEKRGGEWHKQLATALESCDAFVLLLGVELGETQELEANWAFSQKKELGDRLVVVALPEGKIPAQFNLLARFVPVLVTDTKDPAAQCARDVSIRLTHRWVPSDGSPLEYLFDYEKAIIGAYQERHAGPTGQLPTKLLEQGCPPDWPAVVKRPAHREHDLKLQEIVGRFREESAGIAVDTRTTYDPSTGSAPGGQSGVALVFPEAGPRERHAYPREGQVGFRVGILVSGGIAPGINAVIDGIVKRHEFYQSQAESGGEGYTIQVLGYREGLQSLGPNGGLRPPRPLTSTGIDRHSETGGSLLATSRWDDLIDADTAKRDEFLDGIIWRLRVDMVDILYVIGGDGSMRAAHAIWRKAQLTADFAHLSVVGIPKTMDNDILWVWQSFGFLSAVEKAREAVLNLHTEARSNPRLCVLQLFGSDSGFVASHAGLASGVCDAVLIPEVDYTMEGLWDHIGARLRERYNAGSPHGLVVMAETALPCDAADYVAEPDEKIPEKSLRVRLSDDEREAVATFFRQKRRVRGQTPDFLRTGGLKIVSGVLQKMIKTRLQPPNYWEDFRVFTSEPRHLIRSVPPSVSDVIFAERLGTLAVDNAMAGYTDFMVSNWLTDFVLVPLDLVVLGRKRVPPSGIFWKSVLASTGQPANMGQCRAAAPEPKKNPA
jgi:6-phosphofructokinase 1